MMLAIKYECYILLARKLRTEEDNVPFRGLGIFGSGWHMQTWLKESPLLTRECCGVVCVLSRYFSSSSTASRLRFLDVLNGGLSPGVSGVLDKGAGSGDWRREIGG